MVTLFKKSFWTNYNWDKIKHCSEVKREGDKYKATIWCPECPQPYIVYFTKDEVVITVD